MVVIYILTGVTMTEPFMRFRAYSTQAEADDEKKAFTRWHSNIVTAFSPTKMIFAPLADLTVMRQRWLMKLPWGACAMLAGYESADIYADKMAFEIQAEADVEMAVINATARAAEVHLLASLL
jgi:hypothetical protein